MKTIKKIFADFGEILYPLAIGAVFLIGYKTFTWVAAWATH